MKKCFIILYGVFIVLIAVSCSNKKPVKLGQENMGEFAPDDAFLEGDKHPYYGSENA